ncbi:MAG: hypothetical protein ABL889_18935 [Terricaulis sp.]
MSSVTHIAGAASDDEVWTRSLAKCAQHERTYWAIALMNLVSALVAVLLDITVASMMSLGALFSALALFMRLSTQYWRVIGFLPVQPYWARVLDLAPQFLAVGVAAFALIWAAQEAKFGGADPLMRFLGFVATGAVLSFGMVLLCARLPNMMKLRRLFDA